MGDETAVFVRRGLRVVAQAVPGTAARDVIVDLRKTHYQSVLDGLGVPTWDEYDDGATHFLCTADGVPVAGIRSAGNSVHDGEVVTVFPDLASAIPVTEFVYLSRQLVVPDFRGIGLATVLINAAARWWLAGSSLDYVVACDRESTVAGAAALGGSVLAAPAALGPERELIFPIGVELRTLADRSRTALHRHDWQVAR
ncbi:MAG TPA: hypothetical protein VHF06_20600 [Pseudonocardiaceae bacterium]|jgi:GNAT superfamily N-acetyltransferase|nr:hypothetical protein [Pseudonocardiaceae bacterium]